MSKRILGLLLISVVLSGCGHKNPTLKPVNTFSLGDAEPPLLSSRPTAEELYAAVMKFHDSFETVSASYVLTVHTVGERTAKDDSASGMEIGTTTKRCDYRYKRPGKELHLIDRKYSYGPNTDENGKHPVAAWLELDTTANPDLARPIERMTLLADRTLGGTPVYVLELRLPYRKLKYEYAPEVRRFFLGKSDLLPRRIEIIQEHEKPVKGLACDSVTMAFSGFIVNDPLSDSIFDEQGN